MFGARHVERQRRLRFIAASVLCVLGGAPLHAESLINYESANLLAGRDATQRFHSRFAFGGNVASVTHNGIGAADASKIEVDRLGWFTDWRPWRGGFHVSGGVLMQEASSRRNDLARPVDNNVKFSSSSLLDHGDQGVTPYLGLGWSKPVVPASRLGLKLDLGLLYGNGRTAAAGSTLSGSESLSVDTLFEELAPLNLSPVFSMGLSYSF